jgi:riboflavin synthase
MFTGIITDLGSVRAVAKNGDTRFAFNTGYDTATIDIGASIACSGACLTVTEKGPGWFAATASAETLARTTLGDWKEGSPVNFERPLTAGQELGGHIVLGHVDGVGRILSIEPVDDSRKFEFEAPKDLERLIAEKGSIAIDGISLTVNGIETNVFHVNIIPHTLKETNLGLSQSGDRVNMEIDPLARYVARLIDKQ